MCVGGGSCGSGVATKSSFLCMGSSLGKSSNTRSIQKERMDYVE